MNRKVIKVVSILLMISMIITILSTSVFATGGWQDININQFNSVSDKSQSSNAFTQVIGSIITLVQVVGIGVAIIMLIVMAIKYISAAPNEKAELKKGITIYVVGAIILFAASGILQVIKNFATSNINSTISAVELVMATAKMYLV